MNILFRSYKVDKKHSSKFASVMIYNNAPQLFSSHARIFTAMLEKHLKPDAVVLDVATGSGYLTACFSRFLQAQSPDSKGLVVGIEHHPKLVELATRNLNSDDTTLLTQGKLKIIQGDGRFGYEEYAPYDAIHVGAAAVQIPDNLLKQFKPGGRMICPVGPVGETQELIQYDKFQNGENSYECRVCYDDNYFQTSIMLLASLFQFTKNF